MSTAPELEWPLNVPVLTDGVVTLRAHTRHDLPRALEMVTDPETIRWTAIPLPQDESTSEHYHFEVVPTAWDDRSAMTWAIEHDGVFAGNVAIRGAGPLTDLGYVLHPDRRGQGLMKRAVDLAVDHAFTRAGKEVVQWRAHVGNVASLRLAHACGFTLHAMEPDFLEERGVIIDAWTASIRFGDAPVPRTTWYASTFSTENLTLRPLEERDVPRIREALDDELSRKWLFDRPQPFTLEHAATERHQKVWNAARGEACTWAVVDRSDDVLLADITLLGIDEVTGAEIGYWTHPAARGRGVLSEAMPAVIEHAFNEFGLRRLTLYAAESNEGSRAIAESAGFTEFGVQSLAARTDGEFEDLHCFELSRP